MNIYIISLKNEHDRRSFQNKQMEQLSLDFEFFDAITINDISEQEYNKKSYDWVRPLKKVELACYSSHRAIWDVIKNDTKPSLILEDDALLSIDLPKILEELENIRDTDYIDLETVHRKKILSRNIYKKLSSSNLIKLYQKSSGAGGYVLWPNGARKLMQLENQKGIMLADVHIAQCKSMNAFQLEPCPVIQFIICPKYGIEFDGINRMQNSTTLAPIKANPGITFRLKRVLFEIKKGLRRIHLAINPFTTRRHLHIEQKSFNKNY